MTLVNPATGRPWTLKAAVFAGMPDAKAAAGLIVAARTLYYKVRPRLQKLAGTAPKCPFTLKRRGNVRPRSV
jgi:hypothetical protein